MVRSDTDRLGNAEAPWKSMVSAKKRSIYSKIPKEYRIKKAVIQDARKVRSIVEFIDTVLDQDTKTITGLNTEELLSVIRDGSFTAREAVSAFCKRTAIAHQLNHNALDISVKDACDHAQSLDDYFEKHGKPLGPLHGLPVAFKDQFHVKTMETTMGYVGWIGTFEGRKGRKRIESELVHQLVELGAIPIAKTSVAQTLWFGETNNNILGYNFNPHNQGLSSGGSSGGQAALQALRGTTVGFGTDIGGSVSMPAAFNGLCSIKPSSGRISFKNVANSSPGQQTIPTVVGMMGRSVSCLQTVFRALQSIQPWLHDPDVVELPWRLDKEIVVGTEADRCLSFGLFANDGIVKPHPPIQRALNLVACALKERGYTVLDWMPPSHSEASELLHSFTEADGGWDVFENLALSDEPLIPQLRAGFGNRPKTPTSLVDYHASTTKLKAYRLRYQEYWNSTSRLTGTGLPVDAVICPVAPHAAVIPGKFYHYKYGSIANVLDYTTVVIPVTTACQELDGFEFSYVPMNNKDKKNWLAYDPKRYHGAPASVQLLGKRFEEEKLLSVARIVMEALEGYSQKT